MKKAFMSMLLFVAIVLGACGESREKSTIDGEEEKNGTVAKGIVEKHEFDKMHSDPDNYKNYEVDFTGRVFVDPERDEDGVYLQIWADPENSEKNMLVGYGDPEFEVRDGDYVRVKGLVMKSFEGENAFGGTVKAPIIEASDIEIVDYITAVAPTLQTIEVNEEIDQHGFVVKLEKIEVAEKQTRAYLKVVNNMKDKISFYTHSTKLIVGNKQLEEEYVYEANLPEVQSELLPGTETEGIIVYPALELDEPKLQYYAEGYSSDYEISIDPFVFEIQND